MIAQPGDRFHVVVDGTVIDGRYVEIDPPRRVAIAWDRKDIADARTTLVEISFTSTDRGTSITVEFNALNTEDADFCGELWRRYLDQIAGALPDLAPADCN